MTKYAIYARVSTTLDSQAGSYEAQVNDLKARVKVLHPDYQLVNIYGDYGISGTKEERPVFKEMIDDAIAGKFEVIVTKSISRFARNIRLLLNTLKILEDHKVAVIFLEEGIDSRKNIQKFLLTVLGALAEMEVHNTREHIKESYAMKHAAGKMAKPHTRAYGYKRENGKTIIDPKQAQIIRDIFSWFVEEGLSRGAIAQRLNDKNVPVPRPKDGHSWHRAEILYILKNTKYCGRPKETTVDDNVIFFDGPAIIDQATFDAAQELIEKYSRQPKVGKMKQMNVNFQPQKYPLSGLCKCAICGGKVTRYSHQSTLTPGEYPLDLCDPTNKGMPLWGCLCYSGAKRYGKKRCKTYMISEQYLYEMIISAIDDSFTRRYFESLILALPTSISYESIGEIIIKDLLDPLKNTLTYEKYNEDINIFNEKNREIENSIKRAKNLYIEGVSSLEETTAIVKSLQKQKANLIRPKTPEALVISQAHIELIRSYFVQDFDLEEFNTTGRREGVREGLRGLFKDRELKRILVRALVEEIEIGGDPKFMARIKLKGFDEPVYLHVENRAPWHKGKTLTYDPIEFLEEVIVVKNQNS
ncbi:MAG: recombinase family protein [Saccharofermentans sp.]|nr:recombinase family protein [Saccharofermentans sp.]